MARKTEQELPLIEKEKKTEWKNQIAFKNFISFQCLIIYAVVQIWYGEQH